VTWHSDGLEAQALKAIADPIKAQAITLTREAIEDGDWPDRYVNLIGRPVRGPWTLGQLYAAALVHNEILRGDIVMRRVPVGDIPAADSEREENASALSKMPKPWIPHLDMQQYGADSDGSLSWERPVGFLRVESDLHPNGSVVKIAPSSGVALEVGSTLPSRTWLHLWREGAVARWPYGDDAVSILVRLKEEPDVVRPLTSSDWLEEAS
jgi:hypothetical protein